MNPTVKFSFDWSEDEVMRNYNEVKKVENGVHGFWEWRKTYQFPLFFMQV